MLEAILSMLSGGVLRVVPEVIGLLNKKSDNDHEFRMLGAQLEMEKLKGANQTQAIAAQGNVDEILKLMDAQKDALAGQMKLTGMWFVDALNMLVRPLTTYYFLALYGAAKLAMFMQAYQATDFWKALQQVYTPDDVTLFLGIMSFWFVGRVFDKK